LKLALLVFFFLLPACQRSAAPDAGPAEPECTLNTPLVPGVPGSPGHLIASDINQNGASELATLMRAMKEDLQTARHAIEKGDPTAPMFARHRKIRCAWPTGLEDRNAVFEASAVTYLQLVRQLDARPADPRAAYEAVVGGCLACHATACPGPVSLIEKLRLLPK